MEALTTTNWSFTRKVLFRFFFIYLVLQAAPWTWFDIVPGVDFIVKYYNEFIDVLVQSANRNLFHIRKVLVLPAGSGDTSWGWAQQWLYTLLAFAGCLTWTLLDRKRNNYRKLNYWLCLVTRYYIIMIAFIYGLIKVFPLQMPFPNQSMLATTLGDLLPMRLSWTFIGYSATYQIFAGFMEVLAGTLLLYRRTVTLGALFALAVFSNVMMMNLSYDIPVKLFSINIVLCCLYLLANEYNRIVCFFVLNRPASAGSLYHFRYVKKWMRITRVVLKIGFICYFVALPAHQNWKRYNALVSSPESRPIRSGFYDVVVFAVNKDTLPPLITDRMRWQDVVFERSGSGSIKTRDTAFFQRYNRGYFSFETDSVNRVIYFKKRQTDSLAHTTDVLTMRYELPDSNTIRLLGKQKNDSLYVLLKRSNRHYQLAEKQFHWLSEYNR